MNFSWGQKVAALGGQEGAAKWQDFDFWPLVTKKNVPISSCDLGAGRHSKGTGRMRTKGPKNRNSQF